MIGGRLIEIIDAAFLQYDMVILDAPPLLGFPEPLQIATAVDGVVIVTRAGQTDRKAVSTVLATLSRLKTDVVGIVLNEVHREVSDGYYYHEYYGKHYYSQHQGNRR
jgi:Mrp family chromosome partitioning ATPase